MAFRPLLYLIAPMSIVLGVSVANAGSTGPLWHKSCHREPAGSSCFVEQFAIAKPGNVVMLHVRFALEAVGRGRIVVTAPLGVLLRPGLQLAVDGGKPIDLPFERCTDRGCTATAVLDHTALEKFKKGKTLMVRYAVSGKAPEDIPIRLEGLTAALKSISK